MHLLPIDLSHEELLNEKFKKLNSDISEYSFANIYLFRHIHHYQLFYAHELFIKGVTREGESFLMPLEKVSSQTNTEHLIPLLEEVDFFFPISDKSLKYFDSAKFQTNYSEKDSDYIFLKSALSTYSGSGLDPKKNLVKQLLENDTVEARPLTSNEISDALLVLEAWENDRAKEDEADFIPCKEALHHMPILQLNGYIIYVNDQPSGFIIGEKLNHNTFVIHFAKGIKSVKGIYQYLYQVLASNLEDTITYINMEQDLGSPSLRKSKHSYHPDHMVQKWRISLKT